MFGKDGKGIFIKNGSGGTTPIFNTEEERRKT
jgi:hypothetical protein